MRPPLPHPAGTDIKAFSSGPGRGSKASSRPAPKNNWRQTHQELMESLANTRATKLPIARGGPLPPPPPPAANEDYIQCNFCGGRFNEAAATRHISYCQAKAHDASFRHRPFCRLIHPSIDPFTANQLLCSSVSSKI